MEKIIKNIKIPVTKPFLPNIDKVKISLDKIWEREWLTNNGPMLLEYESALKKALNVNNLIVVNNGTIALQIAIKALKIKGEIITTPFSYVATTSSIVWENCTPVFADIQNSTFNIDPKSIERVITPKTKAILATHTFGNACDIDAIELLAKKYNLKVIYDASHCFGSKYKGKSIFEYGDISTLSLHATKLIHSVEGGAIFVKNEELLSRCSYMRNFGHDGPDKFNGVGINGKNSEVHSAIGLEVLKSFEEIINSRMNQKTLYDKLLNNNFKTNEINLNCSSNFSYYPILFETEDILIQKMSDLFDSGIQVRRYFYPLLNELDYVGNKKLNTPVAKSISSRIVCLPMYYNLSLDDQKLICKILNK